MILKCLYIDVVDPAFLTVSPPYAAGFLGAAEVRRYAERPEYDLTEPYLTRALTAGDGCFGLRADGTLAAYGWYATRAHRFSDEHVLRFGRDWVYMHHGFTHPAHRGRRLHAIGMTLALAAYQARGFRGFVTLVAADNEASLKSCARMGYHVFGTLYAVRPGRVLRKVGLTHPLLDIPVAWCTPGCRAFDMQLERIATSPHVDAVHEPLKS